MLISYSLVHTHCTPCHIKLQIVTTIYEQSEERKSLQSKSTSRAIHKYLINALRFRRVFIQNHHLQAIVELLGNE